VSAQMVLVDQRPGSLLSMQLDQILAEMKNRGVALNDSEEILKHLRDHTEDYYSSFGANTLRGNRSKELADHPQKLSQEAEKIFSSHLDEKTSGGVWPMPDTRPLLPFEHYLADPKDTMCFQNAMLASLLLQRLKIPHRFRTGSASFNKPSYEINGHTLIELTDGRILDPTWNFLKSIKRDTKHPKWVKGDTWWWMPHDHYPFVVLDGE
ncbi:MAG: hypothetical protein ABIR96_07270, partial [Bdellovibrionota bacterium]